MVVFFEMVMFFEMIFGLFLVDLVMLYDRKYLVIRESRNYCYYYWYLIFLYYRFGRDIGCYCFDLMILKL